MRGGMASLLSLRLTRFLAVGLGANLVLLALSYLFRRSGMPAFAAGAIAYSTAFSAAYMLQRNWTFGGVSSHSHAFPRYLGAQLGCAVASGLAGQICVSAFDASPFWVSAAITATAAVTSYLLSSLWVFADRPADARRS